MKSNICLAYTDILASFKRHRLIRELAWTDIKQRYSRTVLGPLWLSLSITATILGLGLLFGFIFHQKNTIYFPYLAVGIIFWSFVLGVMTEGGDSFIAMHNVIKQLALPYFIYVLRVVYRNLIILTHNLVAVIIIFKLLDIHILNFNIYTLPQFCLGIFILICLALALAVISTRYRDISPIVVNGMQLFFYLTPIIWMTEQINDNDLLLTILRYNPFYYIVTALRSLLDGVIMTSNQITVLAGMGIAGATFSFGVFCVSYKRIAFWL